MKTLELYKLTDSCISNETLDEEKIKVILEDIEKNETKLLRRFRHLLLDYRDILADRMSEERQTRLFADDEENVEPSNEQVLC